MDADGPYKQEFNIRNLPTRSVTLFPSRAQIIRDIKNVTLKVCMLPSNHLPNPLVNNPFSLVPMRSRSSE
jgi:hypothetical protein